jgi:hypothetical protein
VIGTLVNVLVQMRRSEEHLSTLPTVAPRLPPWWLDEAGAVQPTPPLEGDVTADVCIVGGGYTGLWTAFALKEREPSLRMALIEADVCFRTTTDGPC